MSADRLRELAGIDHLAAVIGRLQHLQIAAWQ